MFYLFNKKITIIFVLYKMKGQYVIIDLRDMDFMKDEEGKINFYDTRQEAAETCGMYEFKNAWVMELIYNHIEGN